MKTFSKLVFSRTRARVLSSITIINIGFPIFLVFSPRFLHSNINNSYRRWHTRTRAYVRAREGTWK